MVMYNIHKVITYCNIIIYNDLSWLCPKSIS